MDRITIGAALGGAAVYFLDPQRGEDRGAGGCNRFGERIVTPLSRLEVEYPRLLSRCGPWFGA